MSELPDILFLMPVQCRNDGIGCADPVINDSSLDHFTDWSARLTATTGPQRPQAGDGGAPDGPGAPQGGSLCQMGLGGDGA